jgi:Cyclic nucleotide-binding domain/Ion transport protein
VLFGHALQLPPNSLEWIYLLRIPRLFQVTSFYTSQQSRFFLLRRLLAFLFWIGVTVHLIACGWILVGGEPVTDDHFTNYLRSFYWTITTVTTTGYGDITPKTNAQTVYAACTMIVGAGIYATVVGNVASILARVDGARTAFQDRLEQLTTYMRYKQLPAPLQKRVLSYHHYLWDTGRGVDESMLEHLPTSLQREVILFLNREMIQQVPFLKGADEAVVHQLVGSLRHVIFTPGDYLFQAGEIGREMYFINRGSVEIVSAEGGQVLAQLKAGDYFGEIALLEKKPRTASVRAREFCDLYVLDKETFDQVIADFPSFAELVTTTAALRRG